MRKFMRCLRWIAVDILFLAMFAMTIGAAMIVADLITDLNVTDTGRSMVGISLIFALPMVVMLFMGRACRRMTPRGTNFFYFVNRQPEDQEDTSDTEEISEEVTSETSDTSENDGQALDLNEVDVNEDEPYEGEEEEISN